MGMHYYMAPLEAITTYTYRQAHAKVYGPLDKYLSRFWKLMRSGILRQESCRKSCRNIMKEFMWYRRF